MDPVWLKPAAKLLTGVVIAALLSALHKRSSAAGERGFGATVLRYPSAWRAFGWGALVLPLAAIAVAAARFRVPPEDVPVVVGVAAGFVLLALALLVEVRGVAHELKPSGLERRTPWRGRRFLPWSQLTTLRYSESMQSWRVGTASDATWLSQYLSGLGSFAQSALQHVRPEVIDHVPGTREKLVALAAELERETAGRGAFTG